MHNDSQHNQHSSDVVGNPLHQKSEEIRQHVCKISKFKGKNHKEPSNSDGGKNKSTKNIKVARKVFATKYDQASCSNPINQRSISRSISNVPNVAVKKPVDHV